MAPTLPLEARVATTLSSPQEMKFSDKEHKTIHHQGVFGVEVRGEIGGELRRELSVSIVNQFIAFELHS